MLSGVVLRCEARNNNISTPVSASLILDMVFPPLDVSIISPAEPLSAGKKYLVECEAAGSRPDPVMTWWLGDIFLSSSQHITHNVDNITKSVLSLSPDHTDDQKMLTCRAENTNIVDGALQDSIKLTVYCKIISNKINRFQSKVFHMSD